MNISHYVRAFFNGGSFRTQAVKRNIFISFILRGISILISLLLVPMTLHYLNVREYGIWLTLSSILVWVNYFDIGLGNGLRNKLGEAFALGDKKLGQIYVSTTFALLTMIMGFFFIIFFIANNYLDWGKIMNTDTLLSIELNKIVVVVFAFFCLQFIFKTVGIVLMADQKPAMNDLIGVLGNFISLCIIFVLIKTTRSSLSNIALAFSSAPVIVMIFAYPILFWGKYAYLRPTFSSIRFKHTKDLIGIGFQFFIIQIVVCIVVYTSTNMIINQLFNGESVTIYNIAYKYFNTLSMAYLIIIMPFWSASTEAYVKGDFLWLRSSMKKLILIWAGTVLFSVILIIFSNLFYLLWVGKNITIPLSLSISVALYVTLFNWSNTFIYFINGIGKLRIQLYATLATAVLYIPMAVFMGKKFGLNGVIIASCISLLPTSILMPIQCVKLFSNKAKGLWNK
jgi:O-antigen/teichoic acid export membrane protein